MINVTQPFLPPKEEYEELLNGIWKRNWLTNNGPLVNELELKLKKYLGLDHLLFVSNGTTALQIALKALKISGEVITTPFSYIATTSSIVWEGCTPVFADIDARTFNIDPSKIESLVTERTSAIVATHVYGNPCDIDSITAIARKYDLRVIFDAAHCFGVKYKGRSIFEYGDISTASFHATKLFHTVEGGAVITKSPDLLKEMSFMRNFGHNGPDSFHGVGINGKNSEFHAAMGLTNLKYIDQIIEKRETLVAYYDQSLKDLKHEEISLNKDGIWNYAYYPILMPSHEALLKSKKLLNDNWIYPRRYFYPALHRLDYVAEFNLPVTEDVENRMLCLPLYHELAFEEIDFISRLLLRVQNN